MNPLRKQILSNVEDAQDCNWYYVNHRDRQIEAWVWYDVWHRIIDFSMDGIRFPIKEMLEDETD